MCEPLVVFTAYAIATKGSAEYDSGNVGCREVQRRGELVYLGEGAGRLPGTRRALAVASRYDRDISRGESARGQTVVRHRRRRR